MKIVTSLALAVLSLALTSAPVSAVTFTFDTNRAGGSSHAGTQTAFTTSFDDTTDLLTWSTTYKRNPDTNALADGGWLVLSEGDNPRADALQYAIFYLDGNNNKVLAYNYDPVDRKHSWRNSELLGETTLNITNSGSGSTGADPLVRTMDFSFDMTDINNRTDLGTDWKGARFGEKVGIWFHAVDGLSTDYDASGRLTAFDHGVESRFDTKALDTVPSDVDPISADSSKSVPEPTTVMAMGVFAAAAAFTKRRQASATA
ncbi:MAG: PEP-CTERM sorting domain-containing protein [Cyanobacteria bacterium P01_F01_bin.53]